MDAVAAQTAAEMDAATAEQARMDAVAAQTAAEMDAATAEQARMDAVAAQTAAEMDAATAETARLAAVADKEAAEAALVTAKEDLTAAKATLALVQEEAGAALMAAALADRIAREAKVSDAIKIDGIDTATANALPLPANASGVTEVVASRNAAGMVTVDVNGSANDDDYAGGATPAGSGAWNNVTLTKTDAVDEDTDTVVLYTDIAAPADVLFRKQYGGEPVNFLDANNVKKARSDNFPSGATQRSNTALIPETHYCSAAPLTTCRECSHATWTPAC